MRNLLFVVDLLATFGFAYVGYKASTVTYGQDAFLGICTAMAFAFVFLDNLADWLKKLERRLREMQS